MKTLIGLFGPPRAGKNTVILTMNKIARERGEVEWMSLSISDAIKAYAHDIVCHKFTDEEKDIPQDILGGKTPRDLYIYIGQLDEFRKDLWSGKVSDIIYNVDYPRFVIESVGKQTQLETFLTRKPCEKIVLCEVYQEGRTYDTRSPLFDTREIFRIVNPATEDGTYAHLYPQVMEMLEWAEKQDPR